MSSATSSLNDSRCLRASKHEGPHIYPTRKPIWDRYVDGEFKAQYPHGGLEFPGVTVPGNVQRCRSVRREI